MEKTKNKPIQTIRFPPIRLSIWKEHRKTADGKAFESMSISIDRAYKDAQGNWANANSFRVTDLPKVEAAVREAFVAVTKREEGRTVGEDALLDVEEEFIATPTRRL